jgi:hypothetical protein
MPRRLPASGAIVHGLRCRFLASPRPRPSPTERQGSDQPERADEAVQESGATGEGALQVEAAEWIDLPEPDVTAEAAETLLLDFSPGALDLASYVDSVAPVPVGGEFIDAPGWPVPGEMADFSVDLFDPQPSTDVVDAPVAHDADTASNDQVSHERSRVDVGRDCAHRDAVETSKGVPPTARGRLGHLTHDA